MNWSRKSNGTSLTLLSSLFNVGHEISREDDLLHVFVGYDYVFFVFSLISLFLKNERESICLIFRVIGDNVLEKCRPI